MKVAFPVQLHLNLLCPGLGLYLSYFLLHDLALLLLGSIDELFVVAGALGFAVLQVLHKPLVVLLHIGDVTDAGLETHVPEMQ